MKSIIAKYIVSVKKRFNNVRYNNGTISAIILLLGVIAGLYVGGYLMFFGGIVGIITQIGYLIHTPAMFSAVVAALSIVKIIFASITGFLIFTGFVFIASLLD